jgi:hypothetical protein
MEYNAELLKCNFGMCSEEVDWYYVLHTHHPKKWQES